MTDITLDQRPTRRFDLPRAWAMLFRPRRGFQDMAAESRATWLTPMLLLSITAILVVVVAGSLKSRAALTGEVQLPPDWEFWTSEMQNNYMQAQQLTQGTTFMYVIPLIGAWVRLWGGWVVLGGLLHLGSTLLGGRGTMQSVLNVVGWASLPFALRDLLRVVYMLSSSHTIASPGLSGFATSAFLSELLSHTDIFLIWFIVLLMIGVAIVDGLPRGKAILDVAVVTVLLLMAQAGVGTMLARMGGVFTQSSSI